MHGAALANKARAKLPKDAAGADENLPEAVCVVAIVGIVIFVESETNGARDFDGHGPDFHVDAEGLERSHEFRVELGDRARHERERTDFASARGDVERVGDEIESNFETAAAIGNCECG